MTIRSNEAHILGPERVARAWDFVGTRFLVVGIVNTLFGYLVFVVVAGASGRVAIALLASTLAGIAFNFQTTRRLVFRSRQQNVLLRFCAVYFGLYAINYVLVRGLLSLGCASWMAQALLLAPMALTTFIAQRRFVFPPDAR